MVRLTRASEGEVNGVDICSAAFVRRRQGFVDDVHRAFAILAQERAILSPSSFPSLRSFGCEFFAAYASYVYAVRCRLPRLWEQDKT